MIEEVGLDNLTNICEGGFNGGVLKGEDHPFYGGMPNRISEKISESLEGCEKSESSILKMKESLIGRELSKEHRENISEGLEGRNITWDDKISRSLEGREYSKERKHQMAEDQSNIKKEDVKEVKWLVKNTQYNYQLIAEKYNNVNKSICKDIKTGKSWNHLNSKRPKWFNTINEWI